jgi:mRNA-degrading endonuclease RelE of RelBE toxin-antitoxin system
MHSGVQTPVFLAKSRRIGMPEDTREKIVEFVARNPKAGDLIPGTGGARKVRFAGRGKGKSGGYRVFTFYGGEDIPVFVLTVLGKGERADISQAERNALKDELRELPGEYRRGVRVYVNARKGAAGGRQAGAALRAWRNN